MAENAKNKNLGLRVTVEDHKRLAHLSVETGKSVQQLFEEAMDSTYWHPSSASNSLPTNKPIQDPPEAIGLVQTILDYGTPPQVEWITGNLRTFVEKFVTLASPQKRKRTG